MMKQQAIDNLIEEIDQEEKHHSSDKNINVTIGNFERSKQNSDPIITYQ